MLDKQGGSKGLPVHFAGRFMLFHMEVQWSFQTPKNILSCWVDIPVYPHDHPITSYLIQFNLYYSFFHHINNNKYMYIYILYAYMYMYNLN